MATRAAEQPIQYEPEEAAPPQVALLVGLQGAVVLLAPTVINVVVGFRVAGLGDTWLVWGVFAALLITAAVTALQGYQIARFGSGHIVLTCAAGLFIGNLVAANDSAGPATYATLLIICSLFQVALAWWLPVLRRIFTPVVTGTVTMLIAVSILPYGVDSIRNLPAGASPSDGAVIAAVTLLVTVIVTLRASGRWRLAAPLISILSGCAVAAALGALDGSRIAEAGWFGIPELPPWSLDLSFGQEFWALLPSFAIITLVFGIKGISDGVIIQQASRRRPRSIDFRQIQGLVSANGIGMLLAGFAGTLPTMAFASLNVTLINLTGVAARRVGLYVAIVLIALAFFSKFAAVLLTIPAPVMGAYLIFALGLMLVNGLQMVLRDGLDPRRVLVVALASALGLGLHGHPIMQDLFGEELGGLLGSGVTIGAVVAIVMTFLLDAMGTRRSRLEVTLEMASLPAIDDFLSALASRLNWDEASALRLRSVGEETLATLLGQAENGAEESDQPRLIVVARPQPTVVELEFVATARQENIEDQLAYLSDETQLPTADDLSLRLLWYHASAVRHQKFHGVDIVTIQVEGNS